MGSTAGFRRRPRRGSLQFWHRKKANRMVPRVRSWNLVNDTKLSGFAGYKAGMTQVSFIDNRDASPTKGEEIMIPVTVIETPQIIPFSLRLYTKTPYGSKVISEIYASNLDSTLSKRLTLPKKRSSNTLEEMKKSLENVTEVRMLVHTKPGMTGGEKKKPDVLEIPVSGSSVEESFDYASTILGKEVNISDVFSDGDLMDVVGVTTGKGFQGSVKRFGVSILHRKSHGDGRRKVASLGNWQAKTWRVPHPGQMGFHNRTVMNIQLMKILDSAEVPVTPKGDFVGYGKVSGKYILVAGSVPGPKRRLIRLNFAKRRRGSAFKEVPELTISMESQQ
ncbi:MAG: 50S ribosomal protein L3 [Candidatus Woesearchaeota archaeon]